MSSKDVPWTAWIMHMAGSPLFLQEKINFESRLETYRTRMKTFVANIEQVRQVGIAGLLRVPLLKLPYSHTPILLGFFLFPAQYVACQVEEESIR